MGVSLPGGKAAPLRRRRPRLALSRAALLRAGGTGLAEGWHVRRPREQRRPPADELRERPHRRQRVFKATPAFLRGSRSGRRRSAGGGAAEPRRCRNPGVRGGARAASPAATPGGRPLGGDVLPEPGRLSWEHGAAQPARKVLRVNTLRFCAAAVLWLEVRVSFQ